MAKGKIVGVRVSGELHQLMMRGVALLRHSRCGEPTTLSDLVIIAVAEKLRKLLPEGTDEWYALRTWICR